MDGEFCCPDEEGYHYGVNERGKSIKHLTTQSLTERLLICDIL